MPQSRSIDQNRCLATSPAYSRPLGFICDGPDAPNRFTASEVSVRDRRRALCRSPAQGVSYDFQQAGDHEFCAIRRIYTSALESGPDLSASDGSALAPAKAIHRMIEEMPNDADDVWLREELTS